MSISFAGDALQKGNPQTHYTLFVPLTQNDGSRQPSELLDWIEGELVRRVGGLTQYYPGHGIWVPPTASPLCRDQVLPVHLVMASDPQTEAWLMALVAEMARQLKQEQIFVFTQPVWLLTS